MQIKDELLEPYFIDITDVSYDVKKTTVNTNKGSKSYGQEQETTIGYFTSLSSAIHKVVKLKINEGNGDAAISLQEYMNQYKELKEKITELVNL